MLHLIVLIYWKIFSVSRHVQRAGTHVSSFKVVEWAKRPFQGQDVFVVGEAYHPLKGWIEGALQSAENTLREGWGIGNINDFKKQIRELPQEHMINNHLDWSLFP